MHMGREYFIQCTGPRRMHFARAGNFLLVLPLLPVGDHSSVCEQQRVLALNSPALFDLNAAKRGTYCCSYFTGQEER